MQKIAFIQKGTVPLASQYVAETLQNNFPEFAVEAIDIKQLLSQQKGFLLLNLLYTIKEYGWEILLGQKQAKESFFRTTYFFHQLKALLTRKLAGSDYVFSFQMQSLYDASTAELPHFVYTDHTNLANLTYPIRMPHKLYSPAWLSLERTIYENATHIFTRSSNITRSIVEQYAGDATKISCVYAGGNIQFDEVELDNDSYRNKNILFVGVDWERKGGPELVEAFRQVLAVHPDARLTIVGCNPTVDVPNCDIIGRIPLAQVGDYYRRASIFCLPTKLEPFGIVFLEAFSYKLPIVATNVGAIPDFVVPGENGYLVVSGESKTLAAALIQLLDDPEQCRTFGEKGYKLVQENYTWDKVGSRMREQIMADLSGKLVTSQGHC